MIHYWLLSFHYWQSYFIKLLAAFCANLFGLFLEILQPTQIYPGTFTQQSHSEVKYWMLKFFIQYMTWEAHPTTEVNFQHLSNSALNTNTWLHRSTSNNRIHLSTTVKFCIQYLTLEAHPSTEVTCQLSHSSSKNYFRSTSNYSSHLNSRTQRSYNIIFISTNSASNNCRFKSYKDKVTIEIKS